MNVKIYIADSFNSASPANKYSKISGHYYIATSLLRGDYDKLRTTYYCLCPTDNQFLSVSRYSDVGLMNLAKIADCFNSREKANLTNKIANGMSHNNRDWFLPIKFEGINNNPIFKFTRDLDQAVLVALNINGRGTPYGLWLKADGTVGIEGHMSNYDVQNIKTFVSSYINFILLHMIRFQKKSCLNNDLFISYFRFVTKVLHDTRL